MNGTNLPAFFDPRSAYRDLVARLRPLNVTSHYPNADWRKALLGVLASSALASAYGNLSIVCVVHVTYLPADVLAG